MLSCDNCRVRLTVIKNYLKVEKIINGKVSSCYWLNRTNMYLPDCDMQNMASCPQFGANVVYPAKGNCLAIKMLCCDGMKTVVSLGINCTYEYNGTEYTFASIAELCAFIGAFVCQPACDVVIPCLCNISLLTHVTKEDIVVSTAGTTAGGFLTLSSNAGVLFSVANPNGDLPPITFLSSLNSSGNVITLSRSETNGSTVCGTSSFLTFADNVLIPETGTNTVIDANVLFALPTCSGVLSFLPIHSEGVTGVTITPTGVVTIPAQIITSSSYFYAQVLCDNTVIATVCLALENTPVPPIINRISGKPYNAINGGSGNGNIGGASAYNVVSNGAGNNGIKWYNIASFANSYAPAWRGLSKITHELRFFRRPLGSGTWTSVMSPITATYNFAIASAPDVAAWINTKLSGVSLTNFKVYGNGVSGISMFDADVNTWEEYFELIEVQYDMANTPSSPVSWAYGFLQLGGSGDAQPAFNYDGALFEDGFVTPAPDTKQILFSGLPECPNGKSIEWQSRIGLSAITNTAGGLVFPGSTIQYQELGTAGVNPFPTTAIVDVFDPFTLTPIVSGILNIAAGGTVGTSLFADGDYAILTSIATTQGTQTQFLKLIRIKSGSITSDTSYNFNPLAIAANGQDVEFQQLGTPQFLDNAVHLAWLRIDNFIMVADTADFYDNFAIIAETTPLDGSVVALSNVMVNSGQLHDVEITWFDNAAYDPKTIKPYKKVQFILACNP